MVNTGWGTCHCGKEYYIEHIKRFSTERGDTLECPSCGRVIARWGKGTDDYFVRTKEQMEASRIVEERSPVCRCGLKMLRKNGPHGTFFGCAGYPNGCNQTISDYEDEYYE